MPLEIRALAGFYDSPAGQAARRLILRQLRARWPDLSRRRLLGFGYATPYLRTYVQEAERAISAMPAAQGAEMWTPSGRGLVTLVDDQALPFPDAFFDCLIVVHGLETADALRPFMRELWRVMTSDGRMIVVVPNRTSLWAQLETSPFGHGQPYSRGQLQQLLEQSLFHVEHWEAALFVPPFGRWRTRTGAAWDRIGRRLWPRLAGVHIVEASKSLYAPAPKMPASPRYLLLPKIANARSSALRTLRSSRRIHADDRG